jgi:muramoyltetrapeptide carboxypeptidase
VSYLALPPLAPNDTVAVVAPAGPFDRESFQAGLDVLARRYRPTFDDGLFSAARYLAGDDARRGAELQRALDDDSVRAVFAARGGYGVMRLLPALRFEGRKPKPLVGFSDLTALHAAAQRAGWRSLHAPVLTQLGRQSAEVHARLFALLESPQVPSLDGTAGWVDGVVEGPLLGGNLSVLTRLLGTPWMPRLQGAVLLLEDVGEKPYRLDRMWTHLRLSGLLDLVAGIALGDFTGCEDPNHGSAEVLRELATALGKPCAVGFPIGHGAINQPVPLGARVRLDATAARLDFLEGLVG